MKKVQRETANDAVLLLDGKFLIPSTTIKSVILFTFFCAKLPTAYALWGAAAIGASPDSTNPAVSGLAPRRLRKH